MVRHWIMNVGNGGRLLTSKQTARLLGVSEASVKRWADSGSLVSEKTAGGHRRFRPEDIALFQRDSKLGGERRAAVVVQLRERRTAVSPATTENVVSLEALFETLITGRVEEALSLFVNAYLHGHNLASIFDGALAKAMRRVGELWYEGKLSIAQEHIATRTVLSTLHRLRGLIETPEENGLLAICCSVEADFHELPVQCTQMLLESTGWRVLNLGPNTPFFSLSEVTMQNAPRLVCVSSTVLTNLDRAVREYKEFNDAAHRRGTTVVVGGAGFSDNTIRERFPADLHADSFQQLLEFAATFTAQHQN